MASCERRYRRSRPTTCYARERNRSMLVGQFGKLPKRGHISGLIVRFHVLQYVKDFARDHTSDEAARFVLAVALADQTVKGFFRRRRIQLPNLVFDHVEDGLIQTLV